MHMKMAGQHGLATVSATGGGGCQPRLEGLNDGQPRPYSTEKMRFCGPETLLAVLILAATVQAPSKELAFCTLPPQPVIQLVIRTGYRPPSAGNGVSHAMQPPRGCCGTGMDSLDSWGGWSLAAQQNLPRGNAPAQHQRVSSLRCM